MKVFILLTLLSGCVIAPDDGKVVKNPVPTEQPTARPTLPPPLPPFSTPTPSYPARPFTIIIPSEVKQCDQMLVRVDGPYAKDDVVIWAEKRHHVGRMFQHASDYKYLGVKLNTPGERVLDFKLNGEWQASVKVLVTPAPENCNSK